MLIGTLLLFAVAAAHWHAVRHHAQQAAAARQAADHLRVARQTASAGAMPVLREQGRHLPPSVHARQAGALRSVLPDMAETVLTEPGWDALAATLSDIERTGSDPTSLLKQAVERRELDTADSVSDVLVWRLRHMAALPTLAAVPQRGSKVPIPAAGPSVVPHRGTTPARRR